MKIVLVIDSESTAEEYADFLEDNGCDTIRYRLPVKAMDNLEEIEPRVIILSATDFPRHWKPFIQFAHSNDALSCIVYLISKTPLSNDEFEKAAWLGVNEILPDSLKNPSDRENVLKLFQKNQIISSDVNQSADVPAVEEVPIMIEPAQQITEVNAEFAIDSLVFVHPQTGEIVTGTVNALESGKIEFIPDHTELLESIEVDTILTDCCYFADNLPFLQRMKLINKTKSMELQFI